VSRAIAAGRDVMADTLADILPVTRPVPDNGEG